MNEMYDQAEPQAQAGTEEDVLAAMITALQDAGFSKEEIEQMSHTISNDPKMLDFGDF
jgi:Holliday junction resolvasome RuvABC DNA-binding subunit